MCRQDPFAHTQYFVFSWKKHWIELFLIAFELFSLLGRLGRCIGQLLFLYSEGLKKDIGQSLASLEWIIFHGKKKRRKTFLLILTVRLNNETSGHPSMYVSKLSNLFGVFCVCVCHQMLEKGLTGKRAQSDRFSLWYYAMSPFSLRGHCDLFRCVEPLCPSLLGPVRLFHVGV